MLTRKLTLTTIACGTLAALIAAAPARADEVKAGDIVINQAWAPPTSKGAKVGGGYLTIENKGSAPDRLTGAPLTLPAACRCTKCLCRTAS
jgi:periplasmic copper chaperone A